MASADGNEIVQAIADNIVSLNRYVQRLEDVVSKISNQDGHDRTKEVIDELVQECNKISSRTNSMMKQLNAFAKTYREYRIHKERLMQEYFAVLKRLQDIQRRAVALEKEKIKSVSAQDHMLSNQSPPEQDAVRIQMQHQHKQNILELRERQQTVVALESDIQQLNELFTDLARIVHEQGEMVDSIEANVEHAAIHVEGGDANVRQALEYQTKARQKKLILGVFCATLALILILFFYLYLR